MRQKRQNNLKNLDLSVQKQIKHYTDEIEKLENPRSRGKALVGNLSGLWRYRVEDYRLICKIEDNHFIILVIEIGRRNSIYD